MWLKKKKAERKPSWQEEAIKRLEAFRKRGESFTYLGITMLVTGHSTIIGNVEVGFMREPVLMCDYVDALGRLHKTSFFPRDLPLLERENAEGNK